MRKWQFEKKAEGIYQANDNERFCFSFVYTDAIKGGGFRFTQSIMNGKEVGEETLFPVDRRELIEAHEEAKKKFMSWIAKRAAAV